MMNISSQTVLTIPGRHPHRLLTMTDSSPVAVRNKIKAIQSRKPRITIPTYYDSTEIRPFPMLNSSASFSVITAERLVDRSRAFRHAAAVTTARPSILSSSSFATQSNPFQRMPEIPQRRRSRPATLDRHNSLTPIDSTKTNKSPNLLPTAANFSSHQIHFPSNDDQHSDDDNEECAVDEEFQEYYDRAIVKCADWLMKYVFNNEYEPSSSSSSSAVIIERLACI